MITNKKPRSSDTDSNYMRDDRTDMSEDDDRSPPSDSIANDSCPTRTCTPGSGSGSGSVSGSSSIPEYPAPYPDQVLENVLENVLWFLTSRKDRNAASLVCRLWYRVEAMTRSDLFIGNCYAVSPERATSRFTRIRSVTLKGKPRFADFNLMPPNWGAHFAPWVSAMAKAYPWLEKIHLKRMSVTDDDLALLAESFSGFKELVLVCCDGFGTSGLAVVASKCRYVVFFPS